MRPGLLGHVIMNPTQMWPVCSAYLSDIDTRRKLSWYAEAGRKTTTADENEDEVVNVLDPAGQQLQNPKICVTIPNRVYFRKHWACSLRVTFTAHAGHFYVVCVHTGDQIQVACIWKCEQLRKKRIKQKNLNWALRPAVWTVRIAAITAKQILAPLLAKLFPPSVNWCFINKLSWTEIWCFNVLLHLKFLYFIFICH